MPTGWMEIGSAALLGYLLGSIPFGLLLARFGGAGDIREIAQKRKELAPAQHDAFQAFSKAVFAEGALSAKMKQLIAVAVAHVTQCPYCIRGHTEGALRRGATDQEVMEAIWVAAEMRAGGAYAHSTLAIDVMNGAHAQKDKLQV